MTPEFAVIKYKVQGATFQIAIFDLYQNTRSGDKNFYKRFCFIYVQLSCLQILEKVQLLQPIILATIGSQLHLRLLEEAAYLDYISNQTFSLWTY